MSKQKFITDILDSHDESQPAFGFLTPDQNETWLNWGEIRARAKAIAAWIQHELPPKAPVILLFEPSTDFVICYLACLYAGSPAVPVPVPKTLAQGQAPLALAAVVKSCGAQGLLTSDLIAPALPLIGGLFSKMGLTVKLKTAREASAAPLSSFQRRDIAGSDIAMIQHTSGSTSQPSGVPLTQDQMSYMMHTLTVVAELSRASRGVVWLPHTHNTGLISCLAGVWSQFPILAMSPMTFVSKPAIWLQAISKFKATVSGAPAFAFDLCVKMIKDEDLVNVDLSSWRTAYSGGESMAPRSLKAFADRFASQGFDSSTFLPLYGMSEATLLISGHLPHKFPSVKTINGREIISCGRPVDELDLHIVDPETLAALPEGQVGEVWVSGPGIAKGYVGDDAKTASTFGQALVGQTGRYLRTGDLGAVFDKELYLVGRIKEIFILQGRKFHAQDIEGSIKEFIPQLQLIPFQLVAIKDASRESLHMLIEAPEAAIPLLSQSGPNLSKLLSQKHDVPLGDIWILAANTLPRTEGGKIQRFKAQEMAQEDQLPFIQKVKTVAGKAQTPTKPAEPTQRSAVDADASLVAISDVISQLLSKELGIDQIDVDQAFVELGLSSISVYTVSGQLEDRFKITIAPTIFYDYPNITALAQFIRGELHPELKQEGNRAQSSGGALKEGDDIAIVAYACRLPGADNAQEFWQNLNEGVCSIGEVPTERWDKNKHYAPLPAQPNKMYTNRGGFLKQSVKMFDAQHFGISPVEATRIDPQQRLMLELCWEAMEHSGTAPQLWRATRTGVWVGISSSDYMVLQAEHGIPGNRYSALGSSHTIAANRLSYTFDLQGPSMALDTACSSSLVSLHLAADSLRRGEVDAAVVGGVNLILSPDLTVVFCEAQMLSPESLCKSFDDAADGYVRSEGGVVMILKRLSDAKASGDVIHAVIKGSAVNQDGASNGITAPNRQSQVAVIKQAYQQARLSPADVQLVEAHGTGTKLGDPIEYEALIEALDGPARDTPISLGSVKSNVGHLEAAAGLTGLLKLVLSLKERVIPPSLHFNSLNRQITKPRGDLLEIVAARKTWAEPNTGLRVAGISSFGFGGTNVHVLVAESKIDEDKGLGAVNDSAAILRVSARSAAALEKNVQLIGRLAGSSSNLPIDLLAQVLNRKRADLEHRAAFVVQANVIRSIGKDGLAEMKSLLEKLPVVSAASKKAGQSIGFISSKVMRTTPKILFVFSGQGTSIPRGALWLYKQSAVFKSTLDEGLAILDPLLAGKIKAVLFGEDEQTPGTDVFQPLMYIFQVASLRWLATVGIQPTAVAGHSLGELAAATAAGALKFEHGVLVAAGRGRLMQNTPEGKMIVLIGDGARVADLLSNAMKNKPSMALSIAAFNAPKVTVISGSEFGISEFSALAEAADYKVRPLPVTRAFHSPLMDSILDEFENSLKPLPLAPLTKVFYSTATGQKTDKLDAKYWRDQIRQPTRFQSAIEAAAADQYQTIIEIGPDSTLSALISSFLTTDVCLPLFEKGVEAQDSLSFLLATLWTRGLKVDQELFEGSYDKPTLARANSSLPPMHFDRKLVWLDFKESIRSQSGGIVSSSIDMDSVKNLNKIVGDFSAVLSGFIAGEGQNTQTAVTQKSNASFSVSEEALAPTPTPRDTARPVTAEISEDEILRQIVSEFSLLTAVKASDFDVDTPFVELGADSLVMMDALSLLEDRYGVAVPIDRLFNELNHARAVARYIATKMQLSNASGEASPLTPAAALNALTAVEPETAAPVTAIRGSSVSATPDLNNAPSEDTILKQIVVEFSQLIGVEAQTLDVDTPFVQMGADSLIMMDALASLEDRYGVAVPVNRLFTDLNHARAIAKFIAEKIQTR